MMGKTSRISEIQAEIRRLEALRGTPEQPPALEALLGQLRRTLQWHASRIDPPHYNTATVSLYERSGRSKRAKRRFNVQRDYPAVQLP